ncbi:helix-turn-helix transcriptional regulator [Spirosoma endophyticum]|uniref:AraC-type DNA-binding protein n=1 Tax=Spirosoma endophyticum TaxID=662367 RepID=A0A1I2H084_9BACT|nr:AraC family transcriptional regulator [Spirosoma endophyticum]SFF23664.1 AraC-type DNA-binding protein [Spirosoma endophyticum]
MKIKVVGPGFMAAFTEATGARLRGRFVDIPPHLGAGYITGFQWGNELRMMIRHYYLREAVEIDWTNELMHTQEHIVFRLSGIFPSLVTHSQPVPSEQPSILIARQAVSSLVSMPSNTSFGSVTISVSQTYLRQLFSPIDHPIVKTVLEAGDNFILETGISSSIIHAASGIVEQPVPESLERHYYKLKCEELLCYTMALLMEREALPMSRVHIDDIKALYAVKHQLQAYLHEAPAIALLASQAHMSEPKLRKLFKQTFGKGVFEYYQSMRMQKAAQLLRESGLTVSEVGYQLGFTNLSHFCRVFEQHMGTKPKKFSARQVS